MRGQLSSIEQDEQVLTLSIETKGPFVNEIGMEMRLPSTFVTNGKVIKVKKNGRNNPFNVTCSAV